MQIGNPLPVLLGIPVMALFCWFLNHYIPLLDEEPAHAKSLALDGLRGLLAPAVFFHHASITFGLFHSGQWKVPPSNFYAQLGPTAVIFFFFISGYLFWGKMLRDSRNLRPGKLLPNRMRRILPAYWAAVLAFFTMAFYFTGFHILVSLHTLLAEAVVWIMSGLPFVGGTLFDTVDPVTTTGGVFWTLQQEWLFYFLLPWLPWFTARWRLLLLAVSLFAIGREVRTLKIQAPHLTDAINLLILFTRMFAYGFVVGMLAAYKIKHTRANAWLRSPWMCLLSISLVAIHLFFVKAPDSPLGYKFPILLIPMFFAVAAGNDFGGLLSSRPMRCLGQISYSFYIFHGLLLRGLTLYLNSKAPIRPMGPLTYWLWMLPVGLIVVLWSALSYRFIERPFFSKKRLIAKPLGTAA